jgi:putative ABC transport system permease protein
LDRGEKVRAASQGIKTIFGVLGWGVLLLGGLGLLVSQLIVVRDRMWLFGLSVALGARRAHIAILVCVEVLATVLLGVVAAVLLAWVSGPIADRVAQRTFDTSADLVNAGVLPRLILGALVVLVLASAWPAYRATTQDPLDVLEPKVS